MILKYHPLKKCKISASWNSSGLYADTITIVARKNKKFSNEEEDLGGDVNSDEMLLKRLTESIHGRHNKTLKKSGLMEDPKSTEKEKEKENENSKTNENSNKNDQHNAKQPGSKSNFTDPKERTQTNVILEEEEPDRKFHLDYSVESIKNKYIYPFNQNLKRSIKINISVFSNIQEEISS